MDHSRVADKTENRPVSSSIMSPARRDVKLIRQTVAVFGHAKWRSQGNIERLTFSGGQNMGRDTVQVIDKNRCGVILIFQKGDNKGPGYRGLASSLSCLCVVLGTMWLPRYCIRSRPAPVNAAD